MKTKLEGLFDLNTILSSGKSVDEVALLIRDGKKKMWKIGGFFSRISDWLEIKVSKVTTSIVALAAVLVATLVFTTSVPSPAFLVAANPIVVVGAMIAVLEEEKISVSLLLSWMSLLFTGMTLSTSVSLLFLIGVGGLFLFPFVLGVVLSWKEKRGTLEVRREALSSSEMEEIFSSYFNDFIKRHRDRLIGFDTEYGRHEASLKAMIVRVDSSLSYWSRRGEEKEVDIGYVERRVLAFQDIKTRIERELTAFRAGSKDILRKLTLLERQIPLLHSEINDHIQDRLIGEFEDGLEMLAEESNRIAMSHLSSMREELLAAESAISTLRLKVVPLLDGVELLDEIEDRAGAIVSTASPRLTVLGL